MDAQQLDELISRHYQRLYRAAVVLTGHRWDAEDLVQETLLQALKSSFSGRSQPETWLYSILLNQHRSGQRSRRRMWRRWIGWLARQPARRSTRPEDQLLAQEWQVSLWKTVAQLPQAQRDVVVLRYAEQFSYSQIAELLQCPIGTVKSRLHHALQALEQRLGDERPERSPNGHLEDPALWNSWKPNAGAVCHE